MPAFDLLSRVQKSLSRALPAGSRLLVAVSGGPDSVVLAHLLRRCPYPLVLGHVDHALRPDSKSDAQFVRRVAAHWEIPFIQKRVAVSSFAKSAGMSIEEAARDRRYRALGAMARARRCAAVVTAHTRNDQAETVLMNFLRGSGPSGLAGIPLVRTLDKTALPLVRPLLEVRREEIMGYLKAHRLPFRKDPTNRLRKFTRNRIRLETLPLLARYFPGLAERLSQTCDIFREEEDFWQKCVTPELAKTVRKDNQRATIDLRILFGYHKALSRRILRYLLPGSSFQDIERIFTLAQSPEGESQVQLSNGFSVKRHASKLTIRRP